MSNSEDDDWFNMDENEIERNLQEHINRQDELKTQDEHIECSTNVVKAYFEQLKESTGAYENYDNYFSAGRFSTFQLEKMLKKDSLNMFYYISSLTSQDIFVDQLDSGDTWQRIAVYIDIVTALCKLELPGFNMQWLEKFFGQVVRFESIQLHITKKFNLALNDNWIPKLKQLICNIKWLLLRAHNLGVLSEQFYKFVHCFSEFHLPTPSSNDSLRVELVETLKICETALKHSQIEKLTSIQDVQGFTFCGRFVYPTLDELICPGGAETKSSIIPTALDDKTAYIRSQQELLRANFILPLRELINNLSTKDNIIDLKAKHVILPNTRLMLSPSIGKDTPYSLIYLVCNDDDKAQCDTLKIGTLLCFTSSYAFEDLILATYASNYETEDGSTQIGIEIVKQFNSLNFFDRPLIMFEAPVFFDPYLRVYNQLNMCNIGVFPMQRYIVDGLIETTAPAYLDQLCQYTYNGCSFTPDNPPINLPLNDTQRTAFGAALSNEFCLIQGPPGTGKTHLVVELVKTLIESNTGPIIVLTYTNESLDKFLLKASRHTQNIVRFGNQIRQPEIDKFHIRNSLEDVRLPQQLRQLYDRAKKEYKARCTKIREQHRMRIDSSSYCQEILTAQQELLRLKTFHALFQYYAAHDKDIIGMTTTCAARLNFLLNLLKSKVFVFEEAAEIQESHIVACLTPFTEHVVMVGDHKQLQPLNVGQKSASNVSLFERLIQQGHPLSVLNVQYRMRSCIADLLVPTMYEKLICDASVLEYQDVRQMDKNMYFVTHSEPEFLIDKSFLNKHEARELVQLAQHLILEANYEQSDIIILSFYGAQVKLIQKLLPKNLEGIRVNTVDSFQGLEANIVLLSLVRSNDAGTIGFLSVPNRCCVALSRARWGLYMIGNMDALQQGSCALWSVIRSKLQACNCIGDIFPIRKH